MARPCGSAGLLEGRFDPVRAGGAGDGRRPDHRPPDASRETLSCQVSKRAARSCCPAAARKRAPNSPLAPRPRPLRAGVGAQRPRALLSRIQWRPTPDGKTFVMVRRGPANRIVVLQNLPELVRRLREASPAGQ